MNDNLTLQLYLFHSNQNIEPLILYFFIYQLIQLFYNFVVRIFFIYMILIKIML